MYFCNVVSKTRLYQLIALYNSIRDTCADFKVFVLCMDNDTARILKQAELENAILITLEDIENEVPKSLKSTRSTSEYCWTLKPVLLSYVFEHFENIDWLTYLDADMYFFSNPQKILSLSDSCSVLLSEHDSNEQIKFVEEAVGRFNAGLVSFKNSINGKDCLHWWKKQCLKWCYNTTVTGQFGDQKYLEDIFILFKDTCPITVPGVNIAPWNDAKYSINLKEGKLYINDDPLILYHYCGFRLINKDNCVFMFGNTCKPIIHNPYMKAVKDTVNLVESIEPGFDGCFIEESKAGKFQTFSLDTIWTAQNEAGGYC